MTLIYFIQKYYYDLPEVDAEFVTDCKDLSLVCKSLVCKNKNKVDEIAMSAISSLVLKNKEHLKFIILIKHYIYIHCKLEI